MEGFVVVQGLVLALWVYSLRLVTHGASARKFPAWAAGTVLAFLAALLYRLLLVTVA